MNGQYLVVRIGTQWYGLPLRYVMEVLHLVALNELPGTSPHILGLATLRENIMPVIDMRLLFGNAEAKLTLNTPMIALREANTTSIMLVGDEVDNVVALEGDLQSQAESPYVLGAARNGKRLIMALDVPRLVAEHAQMTPGA